jgi:hypothetical protein
MGKFGYVLPVEDYLIAVITGETRYKLLFTTKLGVRPTASTRQHN